MIGNDEFKALGIEVRVKSWYLCGYKILVSLRLQILVSLRLQILVSLR